MEVTDIIILVIILGVLFFIMNFLDRKSTSIILKYNHMLNDEQKRNKWLEYSSKDEIRNELNPLVRIFMRKFGPDKGMVIFSFVWDTPWFAFIILCMVFDVLPEWYGYVVISFLCGALYVQILKAFTIVKRCKKIGIEL